MVKASLYKKIVVKVGSNVLTKEDGMLNISPDGAYCRANFPAEERRGTGDSCYFRCSGGWTCGS